MRINCKVEHRLIAISMCVIMLICCFTVEPCKVFAKEQQHNSNETVMSTTEMTSNFSEVKYLSDEEAKCFIGFLYSTNNLTDEQLNNNDMFKLMTGRLSDEKEEYAGSQFVMFLNARLQENSKKLSLLEDNSEKFLIDYLETKANGDMASEIINSTLHEIGKSFIGYLLDEYTVSGKGLQNMEKEWAETGLISIEQLKNLVSIKEKVKEYRDNVLALSNALIYTSSVNRNEMYDYFLVYKSNLSIKYEVSEEAFDLTMEANALYNDKLSIIRMIQPEAANWPFLDKKMLLWATEDRIKLIEKWAEYTYFLERRLENNTIPTNTEETKKGIQYAYIDSKYLEYYVTTDGVVITKYSGKYAYARIPNELEGKPVIAIGEGAFSENRVLREIVIPASINRIGQNAFLNCYGLIKVVISNGNTDIGNRAFGIKRSKEINGIKYTFDKGIGAEIYGPSASKVSIYAGQSGNKFISTDWDGKKVEEVVPIDDVYYIDTVAQLAWVSRQVSQGETFEGKTVYISGIFNFQKNQWTPIGSYSNDFCGKIVIKFCEINQFYRHLSSGYYYAELRNGLFGKVKTPYVSVENLSMNDVDVWTSGYQSVHVGALFGCLEVEKNGKINFENCKFSGSVYSNKGYDGGVIGYAIFKKMQCVNLKKCIWIFKWEEQQAI